MDGSTILVRNECEADYLLIHSINVAAFGHELEADLVDGLRSESEPIVSLVAERDAEVIGHVLFTPVMIEHPQNPWTAMALGPMAVRPDVQRRGVGSALIRRGLDRCRMLNALAVFVLGHPEYYPRFGFEPAAPHGFTCQWPVSHEVFMMKRLAIHLPPPGLVRYHPLFDEAT